MLTTIVSSKMKRVAYKQLQELAKTVVENGEV